MHVLLFFLHSDKVQMDKVRRHVHFTFIATARWKRILFSVHSFWFSELILVLTIKNINLSLKQKKLVKENSDVFALSWFFFPVLS